MWDPKPINLAIFTLFSPGHLLLYYSLLPPATLDPRASVTVLTAIAFGTLLSIQLIFLKASFSQQANDSALVHGEVMNEYDTKFVRPSLNRPVRDVGIQTRESAMTPRGTKTREVDIYTPTTIINRGFRTNPNPNYANQYDPNHLASSQEGIGRRASTLPVSRSTSTPSLVTPTAGYVNGYTGTADFSSPLKAHHERLRERSPVKGDGGSMGVFTHAASPLKKTGSSSHFKPDGRPGSALKRVSTPGTGSGGGIGGPRRATGHY